LIFSPLLALTAPISLTNDYGLSWHILSDRQAPKAPPPCQPLSPAPTEDETRARFDKFANAFLVTKNITEAFTYISAGYIVCLCFSISRSVFGDGEYLSEFYVLTSSMLRTTTH
jgi:hypothetical protein